MPLSKELMCSDALCRAMITNLNFELYFDVTTNSTKLGSTKWEGNIVSFSDFFIWIVLSLCSTLRPFFCFDLEEVL